MKTIYVGFDGSKTVMEQTDIDIKIPVLFRYYKTLDSFSLFIDADIKRFKQMKKNIKNSPDKFKYLHSNLICPTKEFSNPEAWEIDNLEYMDEDMRERLLHYWVGYTDYWFKTYCNENVRMWRGDETTLATRFYLNDTIISEANNCTFILSGDYNGIRFSKLSNVLIHIFGNYYEVE